MKTAAYIMLLTWVAGAQAYTLSLNPPMSSDMQTGSALSVGSEALARYSHKIVIDPELPAPTGLTLEASPRNNTHVPSIRPPSFLDADFYDFAAYQSGVVRFVMPGKVAPFAALAREELSEVQDRSRIGAGAGAKLQLSPNANLGTELLLFPPMVEMSGDVLKNADMKMMTRLELKF